MKDARARSLLVFSVSRTDCATGCSSPARPRGRFLFVKAARPVSATVSVASYCFRAIKQTIGQIEPLLLFCFVCVFIRVLPIASSPCSFYELASRLVRHPMQCDAAAAAAEAGPARAEI
jgi:hypothetical protein